MPMASPDSVVVGNAPAVLHFVFTGRDFARPIAAIKECVVDLTGDAYTCREAFISRYINHSIWLSSPIACSTISGVIICVWSTDSSSHRPSTRQMRAIQGSASSFVAFAGNAEKIVATFWPDMTSSFLMRVLVAMNYCILPVPSIAFRGGGAATGSCPNATRDVVAENFPPSVRVAPLESGNDVELAEGPKIPGSEFHKRDTGQFGLDAVENLLLHLGAPIKLCTRTRQSECDTVATLGRINPAGDALHARNLKHCLGDMSIRIYASFFSALFSQVLVALISSPHYVPPSKKSKPGRLP